MTGEEASNQINDIKTELAAHWLKKDIEALDMALSALSEELSEDGTLIVHIKDGSKVKRVLVMGDNIFGGLYYPDSAENKGEWIPVSERLPEKNTRCLVAVGLFNLTQIATYSNLMGTIDHRIFYQGDYGRENFEDITEYVKAWQPLPEPYKENDTWT